MTDRFRLTLAQLGATVGALDDNAARARAAWEDARAAHADLLALPEMFLTGGPLRDLARRPAFLSHVDRVLRDLARACADGPALGIGAPMRVGDAVHNAYVILKDGEIAAQIHKHHLSRDAGTEEDRTYSPGQMSGPYRIGPLRIGTPIGGDAWQEDVAETLAETGAEILLVPNASAYHRQKLGLRQAHMVARVIETELPLVYLNAVGGQGAQVCDGGSFVLNPGGALAVQLPLLADAVTHVEFTRGPEGWRAEEGARASVPDTAEQDYQVMVRALRDHMRHAGIAHAVLALSDGPDRALCAAIAADAIGPENLRCIDIRGKDAEARDDLAELAERLGCRLDVMPLGAAQDACAAALGPLIGNPAADMGQAVAGALRAALVTGLADGIGALVLVPDDKSALATGRASGGTGGVAGVYNPIRDLYHSEVAAACRWRNANHRDWMRGPAGEAIPMGLVDPPQGEDDLPPAPVLDRILTLLLDRQASLAEAVAEGFDITTVQAVETLIRRGDATQGLGADGPRLTDRALGVDRRYPSGHHWCDPGL